MGMKLARGEYILFVDSDDAITRTALKELFQAFKGVKADVIHCSAFYRADENDTLSDYRKMDIVIGTPNVVKVSQSIALNDDLAERVKKFGSGGFNTTPWNYLFRREFLLQNQINFPDLMHGEDEIFCFCAIYMAKVLVLIPNVYYIYRIRKDSVNRKKPPLEKHIHDWFGSTLQAVEIYDNFMNKFSIFRDNPELKYAVFELFADHNVSHHIFPLYAQIPAPQLDGLIRKELADVKDKTALTAFLFSRMNVFNLQLMQAQQMLMQKDAQINELKKQLESLR